MTIDTDKLATSDPASLPESFADLVPYVKIWDLPGTGARYARRLNSTYPELKQFYDAFAARLPDLKAYLDPKSLNELDDADRRLVRLMMAFTLIAPSVEIFKKPAVPDCGSIEMFETAVEPKF